MTTAYTSLLGLALPVTGELQGTWGDTVNDAITSLLDTAVAGTTTLSSDADVTLTTTTGAANQARQQIILWTASGSVTRNITAPAQSKTYVVINATGGSQSIVLRGVGPTTGVTILAGEKAVVAWNGSDFVKVSTFGGSPSFTNVTVTGTTTLSGLTASTALALNASKEVVSVTNTGTGNNVLATSPTLTTPNLGTPSALTLTNATGLPLSTGVTGTLATTNGGTGLTSFTSGGVVYASSTSALTSGSALTFDGTNLGVGGGGDPFGRFYGRSAGISSASSAFLELNAATGSSSGIDFGVNSARTAGITSNTNETQFTTLTATPLLFGINGSEQMRLTSTGLGIGTSSISYKLDVSSSAADAATRILNSDTANGNGLYVKAGGVNAGKYALYIENGSGTALLNLLSSGNLGLGGASFGSGAVVMFIARPALSPRLPTLKARTHHDSNQLDHLSTRLLPAG
jgi:hypothetical protein